MTSFKLPIFVYVKNLSGFIFSKLCLKNGVSPHLHFFPIQNFQASKHTVLCTMPERFFKSFRPLPNGAKWMFKVAVKSFVLVFKGVPLMWKFCKCLCLNHINHQPFHLLELPCFHSLTYSRNISSFT